MTSSVRRPYQYLHVLDTNSNVTRNINGPITFTRQDHEKVVAGPSSMLTIPPRHYVIIANPAIMEDDVAVLDEHGLVKLRHGDFEVRLTKSPFPLYPGEVQQSDITPLTVVEKNQALMLKALREFTDDVGDCVTTHCAGDQWCVGEYCMLLHQPNYTNNPYGYSLCSAVKHPLQHYATIPCSTVSATMLSVHCQAVQGTGHLHPEG